MSTYCKLCNKGFASRYSLNRHNASFHGKQLVGSGSIGGYWSDKPNLHSTIVHTPMYYEAIDPLYFVHPFTCMVSGPTKSGKAEFVKKLVRHCDALIDPTPNRVIWSYTEWQSTYEALRGYVNFVEGLPDLDVLKANQAEPKLLVLDDMMVEMKNDKRLVELFTGMSSLECQCHTHCTELLLHWTQDQSDKYPVHHFVKEPIGQSADTDTRTTIVSWIRTFHGSLPCLEK